MASVTVPIVEYEGQVFGLTDTGVYYIADCWDEQMNALHCDQEGCNTLVREGSNAALEFLTVTAGQTLTDVELGRAYVRHFCTLDCLTLWAAAHSEPTETLVEL